MVATDIWLDVECGIRLIRWGITFASAYMNSTGTSGWRNIVFKQHKQASVNFLLVDLNKQFRRTGTTPQSINAFKWVSIPFATDPNVWATAICNSHDNSGFPIKCISLGKIPFSTIKCFWRLLPISDPFNWLQFVMKMKVKLDSDVTNYQSIYNLYRSSYNIW